MSTALITIITLLIVFNFAYYIILFIDLVLGQELGFAMINKQKDVKFLFIPFYFLVKFISRKYRELPND